MGCYICIYTARWGRCQEGYGEDPYLQAELGTQYVTALQNVNSSKYVEAIVSCNDTSVLSSVSVFVCV